jgi:putative copper export protein
MSPTLWLFVRAVHIVAMALFVGGQLMLATAVVPALRRRDPEGLRAVARGFGWASLTALAVLFATGSAMASREHLWADPTLQLKLGLVVVAAALVVAHVWRPRARTIEVLVFALSLAILYLGLALAHGG